MKLSASQAAKETGKSIPTITRAIKSGKLSAEKLEGGGFMIEPSELFRVFPVRKNVTNDTPKMPDFFLQMLEAQMQAKDKEIALLASERDDLRRRLDTEGEERRKLTMLLADMRHKATGKPVQKQKGIFDTVLAKIMKRA